MIAVIKPITLPDISAPIFLIAYIALMGYLISRAAAKYKRICALRHELRSWDTSQHTYAQSKAFFERINSEIDKL